MKAATTSSQSQLGLHSAAEASPLYHFSRGKQLLGSGQFSAGLASLEEGLALRPTLAEAWFLRGAALEQVAPDKAYESFAQAVILTPSYSAAQERLIAIAARIGRPASIL